MTLTAGDTTTLSGYLTVYDISTDISRSEISECITVSSSDSSIVSYNDGAEIYAEGAGTATLTVTYNGSYGKTTSKCKVTVKAASSSNNSGSGGSSSSSKNNFDMSWVKSLPQHKSSKGTVCYEYTALLDYVNKVRRENGVQEVVWATPENVWKIENEKLQRWIYGPNNNYSPEKVQDNINMAIEDGELDPNTLQLVYDATIQDVIELNRAAWDDVDHGVNHENNGICITNINLAKYGHQGVIDTIMSSNLGHREILLNPRMECIYIIMAVNEYGIADIYFC